MALGRTPAMAAKLARKPWYYDDIIELIDKKKRDAVKPNFVTPIVRSRSV